MKDIRLIRAEDTYILRQSVLRPNQPPEASRYNGDSSEDAFHIGGFEKEHIVCILSGYEESYEPLTAEKPFRLRAMATDPKFRRMGWAAEVLKEAERQVRARGGDLIWFNAREAAFEFYEAMGYEYYGEMFEIEPIGPHKVMFKKI